MNSNAPNVQQAVVITAAGGPEVLRLVSDYPIPSPGPDEVLIQVQAAGVNRHDCNQRRRGPAPDHSDVPGLEVAGRGIQCGANADSGLLDRTVMALTDGGGYGQYVAAHAGLTFECPSGLDLASAASLPEALFTIWLNFFDVMQLRAGERVLIHGGASGVGTIAIQLLRALGHEVLVTAGSEAKRNAALRLGAQAAFDYNDDRLAEQVRSFAGKEGVQAILDMSGGAHLAQDIDILAPDGRISFLSPEGAAMPPLPIRSLMKKRIKLSGAMLRAYPLARKIGIAETLRTHALPLLAQHVKPLIDSAFPLARADKAHARMESNKHIGKIVLVVGDE